MGYMTTPRLERSADAAGAAGAIVAALCCAGVPAAVSAFTAVGLGLGAGLLIMATLWNIAARRRCARGA